MTLLGRLLHSHQIVIAIHNYEQQQTLIGIIYVVQIKVLIVDMEALVEILRPDQQKINRIVLVAVLLRTRRPGHNVTRFC